MTPAVQFSVTEAWRQTFPAAHAGVLVIRGVANPPRHAALETRKAELELELRDRYRGTDRAALRQLPALAPYDAYYRAFKKTYHVQLQLESVVFKDKPIPSAAALVEAMFMAELKGMLLTAGHDLDLVAGRLVLDVARGTESYTLLRGTTQMTKAGDMMVSDELGIVSTIVYGPDQRTQIRPETRGAVFTIYAPMGIATEDVKRQLSDIAGNARLMAPSAEIEALAVFP